MAGFITAMTSVLGIELTLGTDVYTLGGVALGVILLASGVAFFKGLKGRR